MPISMVKSLSAHLNGQNPKVHVKTLSTHLKSHNLDWSP